MAKKTTTKTAKAKNPKGTTMMKRIAVPLTDEEIVMKGQGAAEFANQFREQDSQFKQIKKDWSSKISDTEQRRDACLIAIREGKEEREVEVTMVKNFDDNRIEYWFEGKMLEHREMTNDDRQEDMFEAPARTGKTKTRSVSQVIKDTAAARDLNGAASMMTPGFKPKVVTKDITEASNSHDRDAEIAEVHAAETSRRTKRSSVDRVDSH